MSDTPTVRTHAHRITEASFIVGNEAAILGALEGRDREIEALRARVGWEVAERNREAGAHNVATAVDLGAIEARLNAATPGQWYREIYPDGDTDTGPNGSDIESCDVAREGERIARAEWGCDASLIAHAPEDLRTLLAEVRRLTDANTRLTDLVRHQRGALHTEGLITDAEYADLAGLTGSPARLEGYDALRGELAITQRERNGLRPGHDSCARLATWISEHREDLDYTGCEMAGDAAIDLLTRILGERDEAVAALATARLDGARAMRERCIIVCENVEGEADADGESGRALAARHIAQRINNLTLDPAAVVGASPSVAPLSSDDGEALMRLGWSAGQILAMPADEARATLAAGERPAVVGSGS